MNETQSNEFIQQMQYPGSTNHFELSTEWKAITGAVFYLMARHPHCQIRHSTGRSRRHASSLQHPEEAKEAAHSVPFVFSVDG